MSKPSSSAKPQAQAPRAADLSASQDALAFRESKSATTARPDASYSSEAGATDAAVDVLARLRMRNYRGLANQRLQIARGNELSLSSFATQAFTRTPTLGIDRSCDLVGSAERLSEAAT